MRIGIDTRLFTSQKTGVGYYVSNLVKNIIAIDKKNEYILFGTDLKIKDKNCQQVILDGLKRKIYSFLWKNFNFPKIEQLIGKIDILFCPNFVAVPANCQKIILTIHDLSYLKYPEFCDSKNVSFLKKFVPISIQKSSHIITVSENSKAEIAKAYSVPKEKISVIYNAIDNNFRASKNIALIKKKYHIDKKYFLFFGTLEPRKNVKGIIKAYISLPKKIKGNYDLVLAGGKGWNNDGLEEEIKKARKQGNKVIVTGYVPEKDISALYMGASLFIYPSFYEGFGIPILEAMSAGVPIITANNSSMPEVSSDAAFLVDAKNFIEIKNAIIKLMYDEGLRNILIKNGYKQIKKFSWGKSAKEFLELIEGMNR